MFNTEQANCAGVDTELFFPVGAISPSTEKTLRRICMNCNIFWECYEYAMNVKVDGYWAGTTETQRKAMRKEMGIEASRIDEPYIESFQAQTTQAKNARAYRERMREAGAI
jgi:WhiB family redox-sensing transcriptional regulator